MEPSPSLTRDKQKQKTPMKRKRPENITSATISTGGSTSSNKNGGTNGEALIDINGVPADVSPLLVQTIKAQKKLATLIAKHQKRRQSTTTSSTSTRTARTRTTATNSNHDQIVNNNGDGDGDHVKDDILNRMQRQEHKQQQEQLMNELPLEIKTQKETVIQSMEVLLNRLHLEETKRNRNTTHRDCGHDRDDQRGDQHDDLHQSITVAILIFIFDLVQDVDNKIVLRHSAMSIASEIICQTHQIQDCRLFLVSNYPIKKLIDSISRTSAIGSSYSNNRRQSNNGHNYHYHSWMKNQMLYEIWKIYTLFSKQNKKSFRTNNRQQQYNTKIIVTLRYLEEQKGVVDSDSSKHNLNVKVNANGRFSSTFEEELMLLSNSIHNGHNHQQRSNSVIMEKRRIRDIAMKYGKKEQIRIDRIISYINHWTEVMVPRFAVRSKHDPCSMNDDLNDGVVSERPKQQDVQNHVIDNHDHDNNQDRDKCGSNDNNSDDDDDNDDIDWEDGDDEKILLMPQQQQENQNKSNHISAVEHTLAMMKETGALNQEGGLQINVNFSSSLSNPLTNSPLSGDTSNNLGNELVQTAREKLIKCVKLLTSRHEPRLNAWVNALMSVDNMTVTTTTKAVERNAGISNDTDDISPSVVLMSLSSRKKKVLILQMLKESQARVTRALALTAKLGIQSQIENTTSGSQPNRDIGNLEDTKSINIDDDNNVDQGKLESKTKDGCAKVDLIPWQQALSIQSRTSMEGRRVVSLPMKRKKKQIGKSRIQIKLRKP